jgi:hypothetical protein
VLGISYRDLGVGIAKHWNFPERLIEGMQSLPPRDVAAPKTEIEKLRIAANLANDLYITALRSPPARKTAALQALSKRYSAAIQLEPEALTALIEQGLKDVGERSATLDLPAAHSPILKKIRTWAGGTDSAPVSDVLADPLMEEIGALDAQEDETAAQPNAQQMLSAGIRDVTEALTSEFALNDILQMVLETIYRGMGFSRTMIFIRDPKLNAIRARFGFGAEIDRIIPQCSFPLAFAPDAFHVSLEKGVDIVIENTQAPNIAQRIPDWHRRVINARSFLLLPVMLKNQAIGLLYADSELADGIKIDAEQLGLLRTLRGQVVLAFKHCSSPSR